MRVHVWIVLGLLITTATLTYAGDGDSTSSIKSSSVIGTQVPKRIELWSSGICTGYVSIDPNTLYIRALGMHLTPKRGLHSMKGRITQSEAKVLRKLAMAADLRGFSPRGEWFTSLKLKEGSTSLLVVWKDKELVLAIPPKSVRAYLPEEPRKVYEHVDNLFEYARRLRLTYAKKLRLSKVGTDTKEAKDFYLRLQSVSARSLPKNRKGW